jgi:excisionase family DNA binding protein
VSTVTERGPVLASSEDGKALRELDAVLAEDRGETRLVAPSGEELRLPESVYEVLARVVHELARGNGVTVLPVDAELTTQQAADLLNVSRPHLIKLLEKERAIAFHKTGQHRRVLLKDLIEYKSRRDEERRSLLRKLTQDAQEAGLYE